MECVRATLSPDGRTNIWTIRCSCGKSFHPVTTLLSWQVVECPKCGKKKRIDYNQEVDRLNQQDAERERAWAARKATERAEGG